VRGVTWHAQPMVQQQQQQMMIRLHVVADHPKAAE
jgi:hypothetical protein